MTEINVRPQQSEGVPLEVISRKPSVSRYAVTELDTDQPVESQIGHPLTNVASLEDIPPNGGYGWVCTICVFLMNAHTWGINAAWGIFLAQYLEQSTFPGATTFEYAVIGGLSVSSALLSAPVTNVAIRRLGTRVTMSIGTIFISVSLLTASFATQIWHLILSQGFLFGLGMGLLYVPGSGMLPQWFSTKRSLAMGVAASGAGIGGIVYNLVAGKLISSIGLPWTYRTLAFCALAANAVSTILIRDRNTAVKPSQMAFNYKEYGRTEVILLIIWGFCTDLGYVILLFTLPTYAIAIGLSQHQASVVGALINIGLSVGRPLVGYLSDRWGRINIAIIMTAFCGVCCLVLWVPAHSYGILLTFSTFVGFGCGTFWGTVVPVTAEVVGLKRLPSAFSLICLALVLPATFAEPVGLQIVSASGYLSAQVFVGLMFIVGAISVWCLRSWKICQIERKAFAESGDAQPLAKQDLWLTPRRMLLLKRV